MSSTFTKNTCARAVISAHESGACALANPVLLPEIEDWNSMSLYSLLTIPSTCCGVWEGIINIIQLIRNQGQ